MPSMKLTKSAVDFARPEARDYELRDSIIPGFFCKITPAGRKVFKLSAAPLRPNLPLDGPLRRRRSMSDSRNPDSRWPAAEIMGRARQVEDTGLIPFVDTEAAARHLALSPHSLECYRSLGGSPPFYKFDKFVRHAVPDLQAWVAERRHERTSGDNARVY